jgi:ferredoxin
MKPDGFSRRRFLLLGRSPKVDHARELLAAAVSPPDALPARQRKSLQPLAPLPAPSAGDPQRSRPARLPLDAPDLSSTRVAVIEAARCTAWRGLPCRICREVCPVPDVIVLERREGALVPVAGAAVCTGCGACLQHCPADGAIRIVPAGDEGGDHLRVITAGTDVA